MRINGLKSCFGWALLLIASTAFAQSVVDPGLPVYTRVEGLSGNLVLSGSYTLSQQGAIWSDHFKQFYPGVEIKIDPKGSASAVDAVINGEANFGLLSRTISEEEVRKFHAKYGYLPTVLTPAIEPIAIYVHKDNPIESLTFAQLDAIYSKSLKRGAAKTAQTWGDVGVAGALASTPITCQARRDETGSQVFFQAAILGGGDFRDGMVSHISNAEMVDAIAKTPGAIGFGGAGFATPDVKMVPLKWLDDHPAATAHDAVYPLVRPLQIIVNRAPNTQLPAIEKEFLKYIFSVKGQQDVVAGELFPVNGRAAQLALDAVDLKVLN
ncbi:PstS family phosphate ABC transporter substrate-binding protein [Planctomicrobium sp. SH668]|uniref:PstS family phosphate ABC transporter substrate-binding protein n=1 Tax=Planctomicrobium sp. SH668 TaxID=3448126 RepID=UPI003F5C1FA6